MTKKPDTDEVGPFRRGTKKSKVYTRLVREGVEAAIKYARSQKLTDSTIKQWFGSWRRAEPKLFPGEVSLKVTPKKGKVPPTATPAKKVAAAPVKKAAAKKKATPSKKKTPPKKTPDTTAAPIEVVLSPSTQEVGVIPPMVFPDKVHDCLQCNSS